MIVVLLTVAVIAGRYDTVVCILRDEWILESGWMLGSSWMLGMMRAWISRLRRIV